MSEEVEGRPYIHTISLLGPRQSRGGSVRFRSIHASIKPKRCAIESYDTGMRQATAQVTQWYINIIRCSTAWSKTVVITHAHRSWAKCGEQIHQQETPEFF